LFQVLDQYPSWRSNSRSTSEEIPRLLCKPFSGSFTLPWRWRQQDPRKTGILPHDYTASQPRRFPLAVLYKYVWVFQCIPSI